MSRRLNALWAGLIFTLPFVFSFTDEQLEMIAMLHNTCKDETGVAEDYIENAKKGDFADDDKLKCYIMCIMAQMACIDEDGTIDVDATVAVIPEEFQERAEPIIRKCDTQKGSNPCENAWLTHKCYYREGPEVYFLV